MAKGYAVFHEMDYGRRHLERGEFIENFESGINKNDNSLLTIGYIKEHDGSNLHSCLRCGKKFVSSLDEGLFLRKHEELCPMQEITIDEGIMSDDGIMPDTPEPSISERVMAAQSE